MSADSDSAGRTPRKHERTRIALPVTITDEANRSHGEIVFDTIDLSTGGAFLASVLLFEVDEELHLEIRLGDERVVKARGKVAWVSRGDPSGMGISFSELLREDEEAIRSFLTEKAK